MTKKKFILWALIILGVELLLVTILNRLPNGQFSCDNCTEGGIALTFIGLLTVTTVFGDARTGKSIVVMYLILKEFLAGRTIISNIPLNIPHKALDLGVLVDEERYDEYRNCAIWLDDVDAVLMDNRLSSSAKNRLISYFIVNHGKLRVPIYTTARMLQPSPEAGRLVGYQLRLVDPRLQVFSNYQVFPKPWRLNPFETSSTPEFISYKIYFRNSEGFLIKTDKEFMFSKPQIVGIGQYFDSSKVVMTLPMPTKKKKEKIAMIEKRDPL